MGLTGNPGGKGNALFHVERKRENDRVIALAGNPNVGKSTVFNALTGMNQHTGNWPGKTVTGAQGVCLFRDRSYILVDLPGTYSLMAHSSEEEVARDFLLFGGADAAIVVCDATCLERNLNLALQTMEIIPNTVVCVNLMDEAEKKGIRIDPAALEAMLGVPVVGASARAGKGLDSLLEAVEKVAVGRYPLRPRAVAYPDCVEQAASLIAAQIPDAVSEQVSPRWLALRILEEDAAAIERVESRAGLAPGALLSGLDAPERARALLSQGGISPEGLRDRIVSSLIREAGCVASVATASQSRNDARDRKLDRILTGKHTGIPVMVALLAIVFWLTITGSNIPSQALSDLLFRFQDVLSGLFFRLGAPDWLHGALVLGVYRVLAWVVSVMLPPMAIFFPLFTLLEDFGYLPRIAFNLDHHFKKACACGKQALTMCMGFGCNAAGVTGCRIIDSPRERLIAILTNNFVPCNGRFPTLIAIISMFFVGTVGGAFDSVLSTLILTGVIVLGVFLTFTVSGILSKTILQGEPSSFTLELPPYRTPQIGKVIVRSIFDRTLFVLGRAVAVAAPAGLVIWLLANVTVADMTLLDHCAGFLDPFARLMGLDGVILLAFILGFPANEIVVPIMIMAYMSTGTILEMDSLTELRALLVANGWTWATAVSTTLFCLIHWPCSTTCLTIRKEAGGVKWMALSIAIPTIIGMAVCMLFTGFVSLFGLV